MSPHTKFPKKRTFTHNRSPLTNYPFKPNSFFAHISYQWIVLNTKREIHRMKTEDYTSNAIQTMWECQRCAE